MTDDQLVAIRERAAAATPGVYAVVKGDSDDALIVYLPVWHRQGIGDVPEEVLYPDRDATRVFLGNVQRDVLALVAEVERLRTENAAMREIVEAVATMGESDPADDLDGEWITSHDLTPWAEKARALLAKGENSHDR